MDRQKTNRVCANGHSYLKSSDCPVCPVCSSLQKPQDGFLSLLSAPARRALQANGISTVADLSGRSKKEILSLHGIGPASMPVLEKVLAEAGLSFTS